MLAKSLRENQPFPALDVFVRVWRWAGAYMAQAPGGGNGKRKKWRQGPKGGRKWRGRTSCACSNVQDFLLSRRAAVVSSWKLGMAPPYLRVVSDRGKEELLV